MKTSFARWSCVMLVALGTAVSVIGGHVAFAVAASIDTSFGEAGWARSLPGALHASATEVELGLEPEGSVFVADSGRAIVRFASDGTLDSSFGEKGVIRFVSDPAAEGVSARYFSPRAISADSQGRLLVFGAETDRRQTFNVGLYSTPRLPKTSAVVLRYEGSGRIDSSFGRGTGFVRGMFGLRSELPGRIPYAAATAGVVEPGERILFTAGVGSLVGGCGGHSGVGYVPRALVRLDPSGAVDSSFGGDGVVPLGGSAITPRLFVDSSGRAVVDVGPTGSVAQRCRRGSTLLRFGAGGGRLPGFGQRGSLRIEPFRLALVEPSGSLLLERLVGSSLELKRMGLSGRRGALLNPDGLISIRPPAGLAKLADPIIVDGEGRIIYVGYRSGRKHSWLIIGRFLPDGKPDESFGAGGWLQSSVPAGSRIASIAAKLDAQGRLLVAAGNEASAGGKSSYLLARYLLGP